MTTTTKRIPEYTKTTQAGKPLAAYEVFVDGTSVGMVWQFEHRATETAGKIAVGYSYRRQWAASTKVTRHDFPSTTGAEVATKYARTKQAAIDSLLRKLEV